MQTHNVSIEQFVEARSTELISFMNTLAEKQNNKRCPQNVQKSVRRRAMSHNRYRIPRKLRMGLDNDLKVIESTQRIPVCRKRLRRKPRLLISYNQRSDKTKWLPLHLWTAKRMKMVEYFGWKVAEHPNDKAWRACYRFARYAACLVDLSYYHVLVLEGQTAVLFLDAHLRTPVSSSSESSYAENWLIDPQQKSQICPVRIYNQQDSYILMYHPAAQSEVSSIIDRHASLQYQYAHSAFQMYRLIGPESLNKLRHALNNPSNTLPLPEALGKCGMVANPNCFERNGVFAFKWEMTPGEQMASAPSVAYSEHIAESYDRSHAKLLKEQLERLISESKRASSLMQPEERLLFWREGRMLHNNRPTLTLRLTTRSKYTHKRRNKIKKNEKMEALDRIKAERDAPNKEVQIFVPEVTLKQPKEQRTKQVHNVCVAMNNRSALSDGCDVVLSTGDITLWRRLTYLNVKVIGRRDLVHIAFEAGELSYPQDYPMTAGYALYNKELRRKAITQYRRRPTNKRTNYDRLNSPFPFSANFAALCKNNPFQESYSRVQLLMAGRGTPHKNSYLCLPTPEDIESIRVALVRSATDSAQAIFSHVHTQPMTELGEDADIEHVDLKNVSKLTDEELERHFMGCKTSRRVIGFATSGGFSYARCRGFCNGYVLKEFEELEYLLVRKPSSPFYFLAESLPLLDK